MNIYFRRTLVLLGFVLVIGNMPVFAIDTLQWTPKVSGVTHTLWGVYFTDSLHGWAVGDSGTMLRTGDGGDTWSRVWIPTTDTLFFVVFADPAHGWVGAGGLEAQIFVSRDSGKTWNSQTAIGKGFFDDAWCFDSMNMVYAGATDMSTSSQYHVDGYIQRTKDPKTSFTGVSFHNQPRIESLYFVGRSHGWACGSNLMTTTSDGGATWTQPMDTMIRINKGYVDAIWFLDTLKGFGAGKYGGIVETVNGGTTWNIIDTASGAWIEDIHFADPGHGVAVGERGMVAASSDSGKKWRRTYPLYPPTTNAAWLRSVYFINAHNGWAVGDNGTIAKAAFVESDFVKTTVQHAHDRHAIRVSYSRGWVSVDFGESTEIGRLISIFSIDGRVIKAFKVKSNARTQKIAWMPKGASAFVVSARSGSSVLKRVLVP
jgi:photosystem II stability/assembly factor-like uncharacterized protein